MPYNTDEFRSAALEFIETGKYCKHDPNSISGKRFWIEQARRSVEGYNIGRDSIPGYYYWYLNFSPIMKAVATSDIKDDKVSGIVTLDFPDCWDGDYEYYHYLDEAENVGEHAVVLKTRRRGYSYKAGSMCSRNYFLLPGSKSFVYAHDKQYLTEADGILNKTWGMLDFVDTYTPFSKRRSINTIFHKRSGYKIKDNGVEVEAGFKSDIAGITLNDDWNKVRGKLAKLSLFEESGSNPHLLKAWSAMLPSMRQGNISLGLAIAFGTGGDDKGDNIMGLEELFTTPKGYSVHPVNNNWGQEDELSDETGWFVPEWQNYSGCMDKDGNSDKEKAMSIILKNRELVKNNSKNPDNYTRYIAEHPIFPYEALLKTSVNDFPTKEIRRHISYIDSHDKLYKDMEFIGEFYFDENGKIMWKPSLDVTPIRVFPLRDIENISGCWVIWEHPIRDNLGNILSGRYVCGCLPPGEKIMTNEGLKNIEDINENNNLINIDGNPVNIKKFTKYYVENRDLYEIKVAGTYRTTTFTDNHPLFSSKDIKGYVGSKKCKELGIRQRYKKFDFNFKHVKDINKGDFVKVPNIYKNLPLINPYKFWDDVCVRIDRQIENPLNDKDFWWFIGLFLGDGWTEKNKHKISISFNKNEIFTINKTKKIIEKLFQRKYYIKDVGENCIEIQFSMLQLKNFIDNYFGKYALGKVIPEWVKRIPINLKLELISGYLSSDGCIRMDNRNYYSTEFVSINLELLESVQDILFSLGIISSLSKLRDAKKSQIRGKVIYQKKTFRLRLGNYDTLELAKKIDYKTNFKTNKIKEEYFFYNRDRVNTNIMFDENQNYIYFRIQDIKKKYYTGYVYNFECETNTYMCHHLPTHNTDPVDDDRDASLQSESIQSSFILDTWTDRIVAEYSGRPNDVEYYYEHLRRGLIYYNAIDNYEQQKKGLYTYFKNRNCLYLLADNLDILTDKNTASFKGQGNRSKGTMTSQFINKHADELIKTWLLKQAYGEEENVINLTKIRSYPLLKELLYYNPKGNFDRVSALRMLMLYRAEKYMEIQSSKETRKSKLDGSIFGRNKPVFSYKKNTEIKKINELFKINT